MKTTKITIELPCGENWEGMKANKDGRFCQSCQKNVIDFTQMSDTEILAFFEHYKGQEVCGRMYKKQLNRPMTPAFVPEPFALQPRPMTTWRSRLMAVMVGGWLMGCIPSADAAETRIFSIAQTVAQELPAKGVSGRVLDGNSHRPLSNVSLSLYEGEILLATATSDSKGHFQFEDYLSHFPEKELRIVATLDFYQTTTRSVTKKMQKIVLHLPTEKHEIMGKIIAH